jgi:hypothetical protein
MGSKQAKLSACPVQSLSSGPAFYSNYRLMHAHSSHSPRLSETGLGKLVYYHVSKICFPEMDWDTCLLASCAQFVSFWGCLRDVYTLHMPDMYIFEVAWEICMHFLCQTCIFLRLLEKLEYSSCARWVSFWGCLRNLYSVPMPNMYLYEINWEICMHFLCQTCIFMRLLEKLMYSSSANVHLFEID